MMSAREFLTADGSAFDRASIDAHQATSTVTASIQRELRRARRLQWTPMAWFSPWMRLYLATFIDKLQQELNRRETKRQSPSMHHSRSKGQSDAEPSAEADRETRHAAASETASLQNAAGTGGQERYTQFEKGLRRAREVVRKQPDRVAYWLQRATGSRRRWITRLLNRRKRRFLDGFIEGLKKHLAAQAGAEAGASGQGLAQSRPSNSQLSRADGAPNCRRFGHRPTIRPVFCSPLTRNARGLALVLQTRWTAMRMEIVALDKRRGQPTIVAGDFNARAGNSLLPTRRRARDARRLHRRPPPRRLAP